MEVLSILSLSIIFLGGVLCITLLGIVAASINILNDWLNNKGKLKEEEKFNEVTEELIEKVLPKVQKIKLSIPEKDEVSLELPEKSLKTKGTYLILDTETTGLPLNFSVSPKNTNNWPLIVELSWILVDESGKLIDWSDDILKRDVKIPEEAIKIHHITNEKMNSEGINPKTALEKLIKVLNNTEFIVGHNIEFDINVLQSEMYRNKIDFSFIGRNLICTMSNGSKYISFSKRNPKLVELFGDLFFNDRYKEFQGAHNALFDSKMTYSCLFKMINLDESLIEYSPYTEPKGKGFGNGEERLTGDILKKDLTNADPSSLFYDKKVVITGIFPIDRLQLATILKEKMGADIDTSITERTEFLIYGEKPGEKKIEKAKNLNIKLINTEKVISLINKYK